MKIENETLIKVDESDIINGTFKIPEGVRLIGDGAFNGCSSLTNIEFQEVVLFIGDGAFAGCSNLTNIEIPKGVLTIGDGAFAGCSSLMNIEIPEGIDHIGGETFTGCSSLTNIKIPKGVAYIGNRAFSGCSSLTNIEIPEGVWDIGRGAFTGCSSLTNIKIPKGVKDIGSQAFNGCSSLTNIEISEGVSYIGDRAFSGCSSLTNIKIPEGIEEIGSQVFDGCSSLTNIEIPKILAYIGDRVFTGCSSLTNIKIPEGVRKIIGKAFNGCSSLTNIEIPEGISYIGNGVFTGCSSLASIKIPDNASVELRKSVYEGLKSSFREEKDYITKYKWAQEILFQDNFEDIQRIKSKANFESSQNYDESQMDIFYAKMIGVIGIEEIEKIVELPSFTEEEIKKYTLEKDEAFQDLYDTKFKINGDLGITLKLLKQLQQIKTANGKEEKNSIEKRMFKGINENLEEGYNGTLTELVAKVLKQQNIDVSKEMLDKIQELEKSTNKNLIRKKLEKVGWQIEESLSSQIVPMQIRPIKVMINDTIENIFKESGRIELDVLKEKLDEKLQNAGAPYIRQNKQQILDSVLELAKNKEFFETINYSCLESLKNTREQIGGAWKYKLNQTLKQIGYTFDDLPENLSKDEIEQLNKLLEERAEKKIDLQTNSISVPKEGIEREKAYKLLASKNLPEIVTYQQIHDMFGPINEPYSENFKAFFKKHRKEFLENPENYERFGQIHNNFEQIINSPELKNIYQKGELTLDEIIGYMSSRQYANQRPGDEELAKLSKSIGHIVTEDEFAHVQKVFDVTRKRERTTIPPLSVSTPKYRGRMLEPDDVLNLFAGNITTCCQRFGDAGEGAMLLGAIEENGGIFVVEELDENGQTKNIVGQSLVIRQKGSDGAYDRLTFDNIEINKEILKILSSEDQAQILEIYKQAGKQAIEKDKKFLGKLLKSKKITQEQYDRLVLKEVTAGTGYNNLKGLEELPQARIVVPDEAYYIYTGMNELKKRAWIDSAGGHAPNGSDGTPVLIVSMDEKDLKQIQERKQSEHEVEVKTKDIPLWYGKVGKVQSLTSSEVTEEKVELIKQIEKVAYREEQRLMKNKDIKTVEDIKYEYQIGNVNIKIGSNNDWYLIYGEDDNAIVISDLAVIGGINAQSNNIDNENIKSNPKLAVAESANEMYNLLIQAGKNEKKIICNATADTSLVNITRMVQKGCISLKTLGGEEIEYKEGKGLIYSNTEEEVTTRDWDDKGNIQMLDLEIIPNMPELIQEKKKIEEFLRRVQELTKMQGREKEIGLDELRKQIRTENYDR